MTKTWLPLEANPEVLTSFARSLRLPDNYSFHDVLSVEDWALDMIPSPIQAILLLFPITEHSLSDIRTESVPETSQIYFMKQTVENACGTIAILHALLNHATTGAYKFEETSYVSRMLKETKSRSSIERGEWLERDDEIERAHTQTEVLGQSNVPEDTDIDTHFIAFIRVDSSVYELDGRFESPLFRGNSTDDSHFGCKVLEVIKTDFMTRNPDGIRFSILALAPVSE